ncbi:hypothetical protein NQ318_003804 [Aromia moschata]|uniref:Transposase n=1 Tax=Aromia moschata TaxID=1265417 RepID=A0AAV8YIL4_9CUCU|nr:hypothetical protein NQ318_003804 [Aromia moschata]
MYPNRTQTDFNFFKNLYDRLGETGYFRPKRDSAGRPKTLNPEQEEEILVRVAENPELSTIRIAMETGVNKSTVWKGFILITLRLCKICYKLIFQPYWILPICVHFNRIQQNADPMFLNKVLLTTFTHRGVFNFRNKQTCYVNDISNTSFKINVWCDVIDNKLLDPFELPTNLNGELYLDFPQTHYDKICYRWIGHGSQMPWPARSLDFSPLDFDVWGYMKSLVYEHEIKTREELWQKINNAAISLRNEQLFFKIKPSFNKRVHK